MSFQTTPLSPALTDDPFVSIECDEAIATVVQPMYPFRLVACASKVTELPPEMFTQCHVITDIQASTVFMCDTIATHLNLIYILNLCSDNWSEESTSLDEDL